MPPFPSPSHPSLTSIPTLSSLYRHHLLPLPPISSSPTHPPSQPLNNLISLIHADITTLPVTHIVNAARASLLGGGGVDGAIHTAAGPALLADCRALDGCDTGDAKMTKSQHLPAPIRYVVHTVGPICGTDGAREGLERCYRRCLELVGATTGLRKAWEERRRDLGILAPKGEGEQEEAGGVSVAVPAIATGAYGWPVGEAAEIAVRTVRGWLDEQVRGQAEEKEGEGDLVGWERVVFCVFSEGDERVYRGVIGRFFPPTDEDRAAAAAAGESSAGEAHECVRDV